MKKSLLLKTLILTFLMIGGGRLLAQDMTDYTWTDYKTKFSVPSNFKLTENSGTRWSGSNGDITMTLYPRKGENLSYADMQKNLYSWAVDAGVKDIGTLTELDEEKLNGYWGMMYEGNASGFPVATMLIVDPDYPDISIYIWVSYREGFEDTVINMLMSFTPN